jgi:hypothetical protein
MVARPFRCIPIALLAVLSPGAPALAQPAVQSIDLVVAAGRPLRVALDQRIVVKRVGQPVAATLIEPVYAYDHLVIPAGVAVLGHIAALERASRVARAQALLAGNFSPHRGVVLQFDTILLPDGRRQSIQTTAGPPTERVTVRFATSQKAGDDQDDDTAGVGDRARQAVARARHEAAQKARDAVALIRRPGRLERLKAAVVDRLPYHPQGLPKGEVYDARLGTPLDFGLESPLARAPGGTAPAPESILTARIVTGVDSATTVKGAPIVAVVTQPVLSADHQLILPEGAELHGTVTFCKKARRFHRNGQLRFLFESVRAPAAETTAMLASLYSVQVNEDDRVTVDEEGGARATDSKTRFIAPALALMSLRALFAHGERRIDGDADDSLPVRPSGNFGARGVGGFLGLGLAGTALSFVSRPVGIALAAAGTARTVYSAVFGRGRDVSFPVDTPIQVQLAPGPSRKPR